MLSEYCRSLNFDNVDVHYYYGDDDCWSLTSFQQFFSYSGQTYLFLFSSLGEQSMGVRTTKPDQL